MNRLFKFSVQDEPFGARSWVAGYKSDHIRTVPLGEATRYAETDVALIVRRIKKVWGPGVIVTVH